MTEDEMVAIAKQHGGRYLIGRSDWLNEDGEYGTCKRLVFAGRARWLDIKRAGEPGEPGPGIQLIGRDAAALC